MRDLTDRELNAVNKVRERYDFYNLTRTNEGLSNGTILDLIRYSKRLSLTHRKHKKGGNDGTG